MRVLPFHNPKTEDSSFYVQEDAMPHFYDTLHRHPEIQVTLIKAGRGTLIAGEHVGAFSEGDLFVIGANMPHVFRSDPEHYETDGPMSRALTFFLDPESLDAKLFSLPETAGIAGWLGRTGGGLHMDDATRDRVASDIRALPEAQGLHRLIRILRILESLAASDAARVLSPGGGRQPWSDAEGERLSAIYRFSLREYGRKIRLEEVAGIAHMSPPAFCRYFKQRTRKTYVRFLNELRVGKACRLLRERDLSVAEISESVGFHNLANFNRAFRKVTGMNPREYRRSVG